MRKIENGMLNAIRNRSARWELRNTRVNRNDNGTADVFLHDHRIATISYNDAGQVTGMTLRTCGWVTNTTASRLHTIAMTFAGVAVGRKLGNMELRQRGEPQNIPFSAITLRLTEKNGWIVQPCAALWEAQA